MDAITPRKIGIGCICLCTGVLLCTANPWVLVGNDTTTSRPSYSDSVTVQQVGSNTSKNPKSPGQNVNVTAENGRKEIRREKYVMDDIITSLSVDGQLGNGISYIGKDAANIDKQNIESFNEWGKDLRNVGAVVVTIPSDEKIGSRGYEVLKEALKIDNYKKSLFSNEKGRWHLGEWSGKDAIEIYIVQQHEYDKADIWGLDLGELLGNGNYMTIKDADVLFENLTVHRPPFNVAKSISKEWVSKMLGELWNDDDFRAKSKAAFEAAVAVEPMNLKSASDIPKSEHGKGDNGVENCLFPELAKMGFDSGCENNNKTVVKHEKDNSQGSDRVDGGNAKGQEDYSDPTKFINKYVVNGEEAKRKCPPEIMKQLRIKKIEIENARLSTKQGYTTVCATLRLVPESPNIKYKRDMSRLGGVAAFIPLDTRVLTNEEVQKWFSADVEIPRIRMDNGIFAPLDQGDGWIQGWGSLDCIVVVN